MKGLLPTVVVVILGAALLAVLFSPDQSEDADAIERASFALAQGKAYRTRLAKVQAVADRALARATVAIASDRAKDGAIRSLTVQLAQDSTARDSVVTLLAVRDTLTSQRDSARAAYSALLLRATADSTMLFLSRQRVDSLEIHLAKMLTIADCRMLGVRFLPRCPSRTTSAVVGLGVGAAVTFATLR